MIFLLSLLSGCIKLFLGVKTSKFFFGSNVINCLLKI